MSLAPGTLLGPYSIRSLIGAGGMGEVYRAHDSKLRREVAVKILPPSLATSSDRRARLVQEAHILATLSHPSIASIFDLHESDAFVALVLELVDGPTVADRIARGPIPVVEALAIAAQIAEALDAAHEKGIIHRDLKPANIKLTADDRVKVLDFGLAKALASESVIDLTASPTLSLPHTLSGTIHGTPRYMSPEQAKGSAIDKRTDIWAFGCVLFEMLSGRPVFAGEELTEILVAIMTEEPDWSALPAATPARVVRLLKRCLKQQLRERLRDIGDLRSDLETAHAADAEGTTPAVSAPFRPVQFQRLTDFVGLNGSPAISPDGKMVAFVAKAGSRRQIWIRLLAGGAPLQVTRDDTDHEEPRWTPDSSALIYFARSVLGGASGKLWEVSALGGAPRPIATALGGGDVSHDGRRIAAFQAVDGRVELAVMSRDGSGTSYVRPLPAMVSSHLPRWSPDDRLIAFQAHVTPYFDQRIFVAPVAGGGAHDVVRGAILRGLAWRPDGTGIVYSSSAGSTLPYPPTFNVRAVDVAGRGDRQVTFGDMSHVEPDVHSSGRLFTSRIRSRADIWRIPIAGSPQENVRGAIRVTTQSGRVQTPSVSPDGREVVYLSDSGGHGNLWVSTTDGDATRQLTFERDPRNTIGVPDWSPAGDRIAFLVTRDGETGLWVVSADGSGLQNLHTPGFFPSWSGDGRWLYYSPPDIRPWRILKMPIDGGDPVEVRRDNAAAAITSPDGSVLYFASLLDPSVGSHGDWEIRAAQPEDGPFRTLARIAAARIPIASVLIHLFLSPDGSSLTMALTDGTTTNLWLVPTDGAVMRPLTDFAGQPTMISRRVAWAPDGQSIYAAVEETSADIVSVEGLLT
jgi:Tol biopolymer transport system component